MAKGAKLRRRDFLRLSAVTASGATLAACAGSNVLQQDAGVVPGSGTLVFNLYSQPAAQGRGYVYSNEPVVQLDMGQEFPRNQHQIESLRAMAPRLTAGESLFGPSLDWAFRRGSDFLYDVSDGAMAFGQVVFGGPELMDSADIQIMASNRLLARSWVSGLHIARKYMPIRIGRGVWHKNNLASIPWDEPEAYRTLIHEWGHYALELRDAYLEQRGLVLAGQTGDLSHSLIHAQPGEAAPYSVVMPQITLHSESIMATTEGKSELITHAVGSSAKRKSEEWGIIQARFPWLNPSAQSLEGPGRLPLPLPRLYRLGALAEAAPAEARRAGLLLRAFPPELRLDNCWVYVLPSMDGGKAPARVIAQGTLAARSAEDGVQLLGAGQGDTIVLIGKDR